MRPRAVAAATIGALAAFACAEIAGVRDLAEPPIVDAAIDEPMTSAEAAVDAACGQPDDPANCGECSYACPGTPCHAGMCDPTSVAASPPGGRGLVLDETRFLYWAVDRLDGGLFSVVSGASATPNLAVSAPAPSALTVFQGTKRDPIAAPSLYWIEHADGGAAAIRRCMGGYGICQPGTARDIGASIGAIDLSAPSRMRVCWTTNDTVLCLDDGSTGASIVASGLNAASTLLATEEGVYFGVASGLAFCPLAGCSGPPPVVATKAAVVAIAVGPDPYVYAATAEGDVVRLARGADGGAPVAQLETIAPSQGAISALKVGDTRVYWTTFDPSDGRLVAWTKSTSSTRTLATGQHAPRALVVDELRVYWLTSGEDVGSTGVWALPK